MLMILPDRDRFKEIESSLNNEKINSIVASLTDHGVQLTIPKFTIQGDFDLSNTLATMGMPVAFNPDQADFSGMDGNHDLYIADVIHKAYCSIDEKGTEAAAATGVIIGYGAAPSHDADFLADRPFIFIIRDIETSTILFVGRVTNPLS